MAQRFQRCDGAGLPCHGVSRWGLWPTGTGGRNNPRQFVLVRVPHDAGHARQGCHFFRSTLRVATRDHDLRRRIPPLHSADGRPRVLVRRRRNRARVQHDDRRLLRGPSPLQPAFLELAFEGRAVSLCSAAAEVLYVVAGHVPMLTHPC